MTPEDSPPPTLPVDTTIDHGAALRQQMLLARRQLDNPLWKVQCSRVKRDGTRCRKWAMKGGTLCQKHGGSAKHIRLKAESRLEELKNHILTQLTLPALDTVVSLLNAEDEKVRLKAAQDILDRAGLAPVRTQHNVNENTTHHVAHLDDEISQLFAARGVTLPDGSPRPDATTGPALPPPPPITDVSSRDLQLPPSQEDIQDIEIVEEPDDDPSSLFVPPHYAPIPPDPRSLPTDLPHTDPTP